jgi:hypothetical protein
MAITMSLQLDLDTLELIGYRLGVNVVHFEVVQWADPEVFASTVCQEVGWANTESMAS